MKDLTHSLTQPEQDYLTECEERIERGLQTFVEVGTALAMIRDNKLYRAEHPTFADYCEARWQIGRAHAYRMIDAAQAVSPIGDTDLPMPTKESQARELARIPDAERVEAWRRAHEATAGKPTAAAIRAAANPDHPAPRGEEPAPGSSAGAVNTDVDEDPVSPGSGDGTGESAAGPAGSPVSPTAVEDDTSSADASGTGHSSPVVRDDAVPAGAAADQSPATAPVNPSDLVNAIRGVLRFDVDEFAQNADADQIEELGAAFELLDEFRSKALAALIRANGFAENKAD